MTTASVDVHYERRAFYNWALTEHPSVTQQAFWSLLMEFNNRASIKSTEGIWYWPLEFTLPNTQVMTYLNLKNRQQVIYYRKDLIRAGRFTYTEGKGCACGFYRMVPFSSELFPTLVKQEGTNRLRYVWSKLFRDVPKVV